MFDDNNWLNIYYSNFGTMFGITKVENKYIMKFLTMDGEVIYSKDYTELFSEFNPNIVYGYIEFTDHDTDYFDTDKYIENLLF